LTKIVIHFRDGTPDADLQAVERIEFQAERVTFKYLDFERMRRKHVVYKHEQIDWLELRQY
jgi:hypothetical protein